MPLAAGTRLGPYEILSAAGAGSMGEVYRARDPRLGREVALKVIAGDMGREAERLLRFEREARAVAALDHPSVLSIHDVGIHDSHAYVVFELLEGETLRERLLRGPLSPRKAVELGIQVCQGLSAAHARGIVHRDLKPANLFLTRDGRVKILDFGLARLTEPLADDLHDAATRTGTDHGAWLGTPGYIAPERLRGASADGRSDLFALGAVLYEAVTGRRAFKGSTPADTFSAILNQDPPPLNASSGGIPPGFERVALRCLEKDPEERFQSARDLAFALEAVQGSTTAEPLPEGTHRVSVRRWRHAAAAGLALALAVGLGVASGRYLWDRPTPKVLQLTFRRGYIGYGRFAPDGRTVVYSAAWDGKPFEIYATRTDSVESRPLGLRLAQVLSVSPAGHMALKIDSDNTVRNSRLGTLAVVPLGGGTPREVLEDVPLADWMPGGQEFCVLRLVDGNYQVELPPGTLLYRPKGFVHDLRVSPDGRRVGFIEESPSGPGIVVVELATRESKLLARIPANSWGLAWVPQGNEIWFTAGATTTRDIIALDLKGRQRLVYRPMAMVRLDDISSDGRVLLARSTDRFGVMVLWPDETIEREASVYNATYLVDLSADGRTLVLGEGTEAIPGLAGPQGALWLRRAGSDDAVRLGQGRGLNLSPDGKSVLVLQGDPPRLMEMPTGPGPSRTIELGGVTPLSAGFVPPEGRQLVVRGLELGQSQRLWVLDRAGGTPRSLTPELPPGSVFAVSPDGRKVAVSTFTTTLSLFPLDGSEPREIRGLGPNHLVRRWSSDGRAVFLEDYNKLPGHLYRLDLATGRIEPFKTIRPEDPTGVLFCVPIVPSGDGRSYAYHYLRVLHELIVLDGLR